MVDLKLLLESVTRDSPGLRDDCSVVQKDMELVMVLLELLREVAYSIQGLQVGKHQFNTVASRGVDNFSQCFFTALLAPACHDHMSTHPDQLERHDLPYARICTSDHADLTLHQTTITDSRLKGFTSYKKVQG